jgi:hypothetical protein
MLTMGSARGQAWCAAAQQMNSRGQNITDVNRIRQTVIVPAATAVCRNSRNPEPVCLFDLSCDQPNTTAATSVSADVSCQ